MWLINSSLSWKIRLNCKRFSFSILVVGFFFASAEKMLETRLNAAHERQTSSSLEIHNYPSLANDSERKIFCFIHVNRAKNLRVDRHLETNVFSATYPNNPDEVGEAQMEIFDSRVHAKSNLTQNQKEANEFSYHCLTSSLHERR